ncbi:MAG: hypothetical protein Fur0041_10200 [Bacteroidia bacterium]
MMNFDHSYQKLLHQLATEISDFPDEQSLWKTTGQIKNAPGNLCLHLLGSMNYFIGTQLGDTGYVRNRELEFSSMGVPKSALLKQIEHTANTLHEILPHLTPQDYGKVYPLNTFGEDVTTVEVLVILYGHLNYHVGQINYMRRILYPIAL